MSVPARLRDLYAAATRIGAQLDRTPQGVLDPCGLILKIPPKTRYYWCTPKNVQTFASTGGDGVHYSYLSDSRLPTDVQPIVMTLPASERMNLIVAESFDEFFGLGYNVGWFSLEQLVYDPDNAVSYFAQPDPEDPDYKTVRMELIRSHLDIQPAPLSLARIAALNASYMRYIDSADDARET
jgi:hypothetical protein